MIEGRALILNIKQTRKKLTDMGAVFKGNYVFKDIIFTPKKTNYNLSEEFLRVRVYAINNWSTKKAVLVRKQIEFKKTEKIDNIILKKEFDTEQEAIDFITAKLGTEFERSLEYEREGWQYDFGKHRTFVEDIKGYKPSIEIEANSEEEIETLFDKIGIIEKIHTSIPEIMRGI